MTIHPSAQTISFLNEHAAEAAVAGVAALAESGITGTLVAVAGPVVIGGGICIGAGLLIRKGIQKAKEAQKANDC